MNPKIRPIRDDETEAFVYIDAYAFDHERSVEALTEATAREREFYSPESRLGAFVNGHMAGRMHILPFRMYFNGRTVAMGAIGSVGVLPEYRRKGLTGALLRSGLHEMRDRGQVVSLLYPLHYELYRRHGWEVVSDTIRYSLHPKRSHVVCPATGDSRRASANEWTTLDALYTEYAQDHNGPLERDEAWWREAVLGGPRQPRDVAVWESNGMARGYAVYQTRHFPVPDRYYPMSVIQLRELVALDGDSYAGLLGYVVSHDLHDAVNWTASSQEPFLYLLDDLSKVKLEAGWPRLALRLVDVPRALEARPCLSVAADSQLTIRVHDVVADWNEGVWRLEVADGRLRAMRTLETPDLTVEVGTLAAIYTGRLPVKEAARAGLIEVRSEQALEAASNIFSVSSPFHCLDWF